MPTPWGMPGKAVHVHYSFNFLNPQATVIPLYPGTNLMPLEQMRKKVLER